MKSIIPYTKNISFGTKIAEITSMSLEHELSKKTGEVSGNFIVSGEYKSHEVSVNREPFLYKLPFSIELTDRIDLDTVQFEITDFTYDLVNDDSIEVDIEFSLEADEIVETELEDEDTLVEDNPEKERGIFENLETDTTVFPSILDVKPILENTQTDEVLEVEKKEEVKESEPIEEVKEELPNILEEKRAIEEKEKVEEQVVLEKEEPKDIREDAEKMVEIKEDMKESEETVIQNVNPMDDSYATYHIHIVKEGESIETICTMYQSNMNLLTDYNDLSELHMGDKIIIPKEDE